MQQEMGGDSPANLPHFLEGLTYPASKAEVIEQAQRNGATDKFLEDLQLIAEKSYQSMPEVVSSFVGGH